MQSYKTGISYNRLKIPEWEMEFRADRASGPGGQNVNKTATKVTVHFHIDESKAFSDEQKRIIKQKLSSHINKEGEIVLYEQGSRSQWTNRQTVIRRLNNMMGEALVPEKERRETKVSRIEKEKRLTDKKKHSEIKKARSKIDLD